MSQAVLEPSTDSDVTSSPPGPPMAERLRLSTIAARVSMRWLGVRKTLSPQQKCQAAESFGAEGDYLSARKKLLDTAHPAFKGVTVIRGRILAFWKGVTLPYPEPGLRLLRHHRVDSFQQQMEEFREELNLAVDRLDGHYGALKAAARHRLGRLFDADDYPPSLAGWFGVEWDFPSVEPPDYLLQLHPAIYEQEKTRVTQRFQEAVTLAEQAFFAEFSQLVGHLCERLSESSDGQRKVFRDSAVTNLVEFFERFRQLNLRSNPELDALVDRAQRMVRGLAPQELRQNDSLRTTIARQLGQVQEAMDQLTIATPRRRIIRATPQGE